MASHLGAREKTSERLHVLRQELFQGALIRERRRADLANRPFSLLLLEVSDRRQAAASSLWDGAVQALAEAKAETDLVGWCAWQSLLGVIVPEFRPSEQPHAGQRLAARWRRELAKRLTPETLARLSIRLHIYPEPRQAGEGGLWPPDLLLHPDLGQQLARETTYDGLKRALDLAGSLATLGVLSPLFLLIAALVRMSSPGPIFFRQVRVGYLTKPFTMLKFRTMHAGADHGLHREFVSSFIKGQSHNGASKEQLFKLTNDPRITRIGRFLRNTSLDELPQLWNVLRGDMSLVGPRPALPYELEQYEPWHRRRFLEAKPGITGLWQVTGRSRTTFDEMVRLDLQYARTRSLWTDIKILLATPAAVVSGKGAR
jgi:lipopolysaccharide/colanic/teichoic acid biosynthesis glycosyltransferase